MSKLTTPAADGSSYAIDRRTAALPRPRVEDVKNKIDDVLPAFTEDLLRRSFLPEAMTIVIGALRSKQMFPRSNRFNVKELAAWEARTKVIMTASDAFDVLFDPSFAPLMPYSAIPLQAFGRPLISAVVEIQRRLQLDDDGFALLWIGSGGHVTPLHHDGPMVHGRWHLVVRGGKQFDFMPPRSRNVPRLAWWDLYRRFSALYKSPLPDAWLTDGTGAHRVHLAPGQMVTWGRRWWHRVEVAEAGITIALSTRGQLREERYRPRGLMHLLGMRVIGDVEHHVEGRGEEPEICRPEDLAAIHV
jgi:hypothetical protein